MRPAGGELIARWREAGEWWSGAPYIERRRVLGPDGIVREEARSSGPLGSEEVPLSPPPQDDHTEEWSLRIAKTRDEKVAKACGMLPAPRVLSAKSRAVRSSPYVPLHVLSGYAFGRGTMLAMEIPHLAAQAGIPAVALTDPISLVGAVEFARTARECGVKPLIGTTLEMPEGG